MATAFCFAFKWSSTKLHRFYPSKQGLESLLNRIFETAPYTWNSYVLSGVHTTVAIIHNTLKYKES